MVPAVAVATAVCGALAACGSATQEAAPESASAGADPLSILFIDLDGFKAVNDSLGHVTGDQVLKEVAARLLDAVRPRDAVSRYGGVSVIDYPEGAAGRPVVAALNLTQHLGGVLDRTAAGAL